MVCDGRKTGNGGVINWSSLGEFWILNSVLEAMNRNEWKEKKKEMEDLRKYETIGGLNE